MIRIEEIAYEEENVRKEIQALQTKLYETVNRLYNERARLRSNINTNKDNGETAKFVRACPNENCKGFLSSQWKCGICKLWTCPSCHIIKGESRDSDHTCNPDDVATAELLKNDTKPCPKCSFGIFKIDGCNQMFCTQCHTAFDWRTGRIETNNIHNPHYFEWMRRQGNHIERNPNDVICGRELNHVTIRAIDSTIGYKFRNHKYAMDESQRKDIENKISNFITLSRNILHIRGAELYRYQHNYERYNEDLRILYMRNRLSEEEFKRKLQIQNKKQHKNIELRNILELVVDSMTDIIYRFHVEIKKTDWNFDFDILNEATTLRQYANDCLLDISHTYNSTKLYLNDIFELKKIEKPVENKK